MLIDAGLLNEAADYLSIVPETVPCYDEVLGILQKIGKREPQESPVTPEPAPEEPARNLLRKCNLLLSQSL